MVTMILVILCIAAEGFMLYCLSCFGQELRRESRRESAADLWIASLKSTVMPLQLIGHTQIMVWSESAWDFFLSSADTESPEARTKGATKEHYDLAA